MNICYPQYGNCIANLACSILRYYGCDAPNPTLSQADELLQKSYKNVVLMLLDGMGMSALEEHLSENGFFRRNLRCPYSSTFPPTTVAATTAVMSGLYPNQSAWLGWVGYFDEIDRNVVYFLNKDNDTGEKITDMNVAERFVPYADIFEPIRAMGVQAHWLCSWREPKPQKFSAMCDEITRLCAQQERQFIYAYWEEPDKSMHEKGVHVPEMGELVRQLEDETRRLCEQLQDTLILITADHGLVDGETILFHQDHEMMDCMIRRPSMEARALNLFVKEECRERFESLFHQRYGDRFQLLPMEEVQRLGLFGTGNDHPRLQRMLGNYLSVAVGNAVLRTKNVIHPADHGGMTRDEMMIPLIAVET